MLEFLGLDERPQYTEDDLEAAIIDKLQTFLLELGKGFSFEARQKRFTFDNDHFRIDLVFYNRLLRCHVLLDLERGKLTHVDQFHALALTCATCLVKAAPEPRRHLRRPRLSRVSADRRAFMHRRSALVSVGLPAVDMPGKS